MGKYTNWSAAAEYIEWCILVDLYFTIINFQLFQCIISIMTVFKIDYKLNWIGINFRVEAHYD